MEYFKQYPETGVTDPSQIAVVGDRLTTDMMLANMMGGWGFWIQDGVIPLKQKSIVSVQCMSNMYSRLTKSSFRALSIDCLLSSCVEATNHLSLVALSKSKGLSKNSKIRQSKYKPSNCAATEPRLITCIGCEL